MLRTVIVIITLSKPGGDPHAAANRVEGSNASKFLRYCFCLTDFVQGGGAVFCALRFVGGEEDWVCGGIQDAYA